MKKGLLFIEHMPNTIPNLLTRMEEKYVVHKIQCKNINISNFIDHITSFTKEEKQMSIILLENIDELPLTYDKVIIHLIEYDGFIVVATASKNADNLALSQKPIPLHLKSRFMLMNEVNIALKFLEHQMKN